MITLDQVQLLDEKIESCLAKIAELSAENDALRRKCVELTNALSAKSESLSTFQQDQAKIEEGILRALSRLNAVENTIISAAAGSIPAQKPAVQIAAPQNIHPQENSSIPQGISQVSRAVQNSMVPPKPENNPVPQTAEEPLGEIIARPIQHSPSYQQEEKRSEIQSNFAFPEDKPVSQILKNSEYYSNQEQVPGQNTIENTQDSSEDSEKPIDETPLFDIF